MVEKTNSADTKVLSSSSENLDCEADLFIYLYV